MPSIGSASLSIQPSFSGFQSKVDAGTDKAMTAAGTKSGKSFVRSFTKVAAVGVGLAAAGAIKFAGDSIAEAREAQKVGALTRSTIKATGGAAKVTAKHIGDLAGKISAKTGIDDEAIQAGQNMLLTFKNIRNEAGEGNKIFDESSRVLVDLSSAMGTDAKSSAIQLGKALNDPVKGITALTRVGVTFTDQQKKQIEQMVKAGDVAGAQKVILRELKSEFGGAAKAQATEADKLSVAWGNFKEEIGTELLPVMDDLARFLRKKGIPALRDASDWVKDEGIPQFKEFAGHVKDVAGFLNDLPKSIKIGGLGALAALFVGSKLTGGKGGALGAAGKVLGLTKPVPVIVMNKGFGAGVPGVGPTPGGAGPKVMSGLKKAGWVGLLAGLTGTALYNWGPMAGTAGPPTKGKGSVKAPSITGWAVDQLEDFFTRTPQYDKSLGVLNNSWAKVGKTTDGARESVVLYDGTIRKVPKLWSTVFETPGLLREKLLVEKYGSLLDGLDDRTITTFFKSVSLNKPGDVGGGEAGTTPGQPPNRSGPGGVTVNIGEVRPNNYADFMHEMDRRTRGSSLDGVRR